jgi:hypothetical protein
MKAIALVLVCSLPLVGNAQFISGDTSFVQRAQSIAITRYENSVNKQSMLYNGTEYFSPKQTSDSHPFLIDDWTVGDIEYFGESFQQLPMMYDITTGKVIIESTYGAMMALVNEKISAFTLGEHRFQYFPKRNNLPQSDFYEALYTGRSMVVALRHKNVVKKIESSQVNYLYPEKTQFFIYKDGTYHAVTGKRSLLQIFSDRKNELKKLINTSGFNFSKDPAKAFAAIAAAYDSLKSLH